MGAEVRNVLVVDDERDVLEVVSSELSSVGFTCITAESGEEALEKFSDAKSFVAVVSDLVMPTMDGLELAVKVRELDSDIPVIILTAHAALETAREGYKRGVYQYLLKPEDFECLGSCVERAAELTRLRRTERNRTKELEEEVEKRTEELGLQRAALETQHRRVASIIEEANFGLLVLGQSEEVFLVNHRGEELLDMLPEFQGRSFDMPYRDVFPSDTNEKIAHLVSAVRTTRQVQELHAVLIAPPAVLDLVSYPVIDGDSISAVVVAVNDVTEKKQLETQLVQAQKLESIGQLAAGIAHEINTPIQFVGDNTTFLGMAFSKLTRLLECHNELFLAVREDAPVNDLLEKIEATAKKAKVDYLLEEIPKAIEQTKEGVGRIARIVRAMKEFSHPGTGEKTLVDINHALENTINVSRNEWKYVADLTTEFDSALPQVPCLPGEVNQAFLNIIINAADAIGDVVGERAEDKGMITVSTRSFGNWVEVRISDTGAGIPKDVRTRIFDPFFTTKQVGRGSGQGLAIARSVVVDKHDGTISFETEKGRGTTFIIRLPLEDPASEEDDAA